MARIKQFILFLALIALAGWSQAAVSVDASQVQQSIRGFGASSAWRGSLTTAQADLFFRQDTGIGLSMLRHRIPPNNSFGDGASVLQQARDRGVTQIWATEWSPPAAYKSNNNVNNGGNLLTSHYQDYANYLASYVKTLKSSYNVDLFALSPFNEPDYTTSYESCIVGGTEFLNFVKGYLGPTFQAQGLTTRLLIPEPSRNNLLSGLADPSLNDATAAQYLFAIGTHLYGAGPTAYPLAASKGKEYWETEMSDFQPNDPGMGSGLQLAGWIHNSMVNANMNAFHFWWLINTNTDNEGLMDSSGNPTKRLYVMGNYSKFVRPGSVRIAATASPSSGVSVSAYKNAAANQVIIVAINSNGSASSQTFNLSNINASSITPWITDGSRNLASQSAIAGGASFTYSLPSQSVSTFVISLSGSASSPTPSPSNTPVTPVATPTRTNTPVVAGTWRINAGGPAYTDAAGHAWSADAGYTGGTARQVTNSVSGTTDPTLYQSERYGDSSYSFAVPAGSYQVTLRMAETYDGHTAAGQRVFSASINGTTVLSNLDLFASAGLFGAVDRVFSNISPVNGQIVIQLGPASVDNATIGAIEIVPQGTPPTATPSPTVTATATATATRSFTATATATATATVTATATWTSSPLPSATAVATDTWRVNAGGPAYTDGAGHAWSADAGYTGGTARQITNAISGTTDPTLYQSERYGDSSYSFAVPAGSYQVTVRMAETYNGITAPGQRVFNVAINGSTVLTGIDLFATAGLYGAVDRVFSGVSPINGQIVVQLGPAIANNATVSAIEIVPMGSLPTATPVPATATPVDTATSVPATATPVDTATGVPATATPVDTATSVPATATLTATPTWTATATATATATRTWTATATATATATRTWTATATATATATKTWTPSPQPTLAAGLQVYHSSSDGAVGNGPHHRLQLKNTGSSAVDLSKVELRYWLNCDCGSEGLQAWVDWAGLTSGGTLSASVTPLAFTAAGQTHALSFKFAAGSLAPGAVAEIQFRFNRGNWASMDQGNDYSYAAQPSLTLWNKVAAYVGGALAWGLEPSGAASAASVKDGGVKTALPQALAAMLGPNPAFGHAILALDLPVEGRVSVKVADLAGQTVLSLDLGSQAAGRLLRTLDLSGWAPGIYLLRADLQNADTGTSTAWFKLAVR